MTEPTDKPTKAECWTAFWEVIARGLNEAEERDGVRYVFKPETLEEDT